MRAIVFVLALADIALQASPDFSADADPVSLLDERHSLADSDGFAYDLVADAEWSLEIAPATGEGVYVGAADTAALNLDVDIVVFKWLGCQLLLLELLARLGGVDAEAAKGVGVAHRVLFCDWWYYAMKSQI